MLKAIQTLFRLLSPRDRVRGMGLVLLYVPCALAEAVGIASILPFMAVASDPRLLASERVPLWLKNWMEGLEQTHALLVLGTIVLIILVISNVLAASAIWLTLRYCWRQHHEFSLRLLRKYLAMPYVYFFKKDTSSLIKNIVSESQQAVENFLYPFTELVAKAIMAATVFTFLLVVDPFLSLTVAVLMGGIYGIVYYVVKNRLAIVGEQRILSNEQRFKYATEAFGGLKEVKTLLAEKFFERQFSKPSRNFCKQMTRIGLLSRLPRYFIETVAFGGIMLIILYVLYVRKDFTQIIPVVGLYAFAAYRVLPSLQQMFVNLSRMRIHEGVVTLLANDLKESSTDGEMADFFEVTAVPFENNIVLEHVSYTYPGNAEFVLDDVNLKIGKKQCIGFAGPTGCGKTTILDIIIGLIQTDKGKIKVDETVIDEKNARKWIQRIGYVPQEIFLLDDTIKRNIALGIEDEKIDPAKVERAARTANLHEFIKKELENGYDTVIGERGIRLSGGQRQRIAIARAVYHDPDVIVFDEATNALDGLTEERVMEAINNLAGAKTILMVAHRLTTLRKCDMIYVMDAGKVTKAGTYDELIKEDSYFKGASALEQVG